MSIRHLPQDSALQQLQELLFKLNRCALTLLERQRALQSFSDEYRYLTQSAAEHPVPPHLLVGLCDELACGFKRLLLQIIQGHRPSATHLTWCLYMAQHFLAQTHLRHYQLYQEPRASLWRDSHLLYWIGEYQGCLDESVAAAFNPIPADTLRGLYQQMLLLSLSNPFRLDGGECPVLFSALAPLAGLARLLPWDEDDENGSPIIDLAGPQACIQSGQAQQDSAPHLRRLELGALFVALSEPAPLRSDQEWQLLEKASLHWQGRQQRRYPRTERTGSCQLVVGLEAIHAELLAQHPGHHQAQILDTSPGGARLLCQGEQDNGLPVGQLVLVLTQTTPALALVRWRHQNHEGLHLGLGYLKGLPRPVWLRRAPNAQTHSAVLQSTPAPGGGWHHGLWIACKQFAEGENLWLQLASLYNQAVVSLPTPNLFTSLVARYPLQLA